MALNKLRCNVTGLWYGVSAARREKLIQKYGSLEKLIEGYVSRDAIRLQKEGKSVEEIRALAEAGKLVSNTNAPKRLGTNKESKTSKVDSKETDPVESESDIEDIDDDVKAFLEGAEAPTANASSKAI